MDIDHSEVARILIEMVGCMMTEDGEQVHVCAEPNHEPGRYTLPSGMTFDLIRPFTDDLWEDACSLVDKLSFLPFDSNA